jgi:hypothetical protein
MPVLMLNYHPFGSEHQAPDPPYLQRSARWRYQKGPSVPFCQILAFSGRSGFAAKKVLSESFKRQCHVTNRPGLEG